MKKNVKLTALLLFGSRYAQRPFWNAAITGYLFDYGRFLLDSPLFKPIFFVYNTDD